MDFFIGQNSQNWSNWSVLIKYLLIKRLNQLSIEYGRKTDDLGILFWILNSNAVVKPNQIVEQWTLLPIAKIFLPNPLPITIRRGYILAYKYLPWSIKFSTRTLIYFLINFLGARQWRIVRIGCSTNTHFNFSDEIFHWFNDFDAKCFDFYTSRNDWIFRR